MAIKTHRDPHGLYFSCLSPLKERRCGFNATVIGEISPFHSIKGPDAIEVGSIIAF